MITRREFLKYLPLVFLPSYLWQKVSGFRHFESAEEAQEWITNNRFVVGGDPTYDCGDYSEDWQAMAIRDGYIISEQLIQGGSLLGVSVSPFVEPHAICLVKIGKSYYAFDPYPSKEAWKLIYIDKEAR